MAAVTAVDVTAVVDVAVLCTITVEAAVGVVEVERSFFHILKGDSLQVDDSSYSTMIN